MASLYKFMVTNLNWALNPVWKPYISLANFLSWSSQLFFQTSAHLQLPILTGLHTFSLTEKTDQRGITYSSSFSPITVEMSSYYGTIVPACALNPSSCTFNLFLPIRSFLISIKYQLTPTSKKRPSERNQSDSNYMTS